MALLHRQPGDPEAVLPGAEPPLFPETSRPGDGSEVKWTTTGWRQAKEKDIDRIREIYNQGIADRIAILEERPKTREEIERWFRQRPSRYAVLVAEQDGSVQGSASLQPLFPPVRLQRRGGCLHLCRSFVAREGSWHPAARGSGGKGEENGFYTWSCLPFPLISAARGCTGKGDSGRLGFPKPRKTGRPVRRCDGHGKVVVSRLWNTIDAGCIEAGNGILPGDLPLWDV